MLDSGIAKMGLFAFIFLIAFVGFLALIPSGMIANVKEYGNPAEAIPDSWYGTSLEGYNFTETWNITLDAEGLKTEYFNIGNREMFFDYQHGYQVLYGWNGFMRMSYRYGLGLWFHDDMRWINSKGIRVSDYVIDAETFTTSQIEEQYEQKETVFKVQCLGKGGAWLLGSSSYFYVTAILGWNTTLYASPTIAWNNGDLNVLVGINPQNVSFARDVWFLLTSIMTFNTAEVFGSTEFWAVILNGIVCSFIFGSAIIFATAVALEVLPDWL